MDEYRESDCPACGQKILEQDGKKVIKLKPDMMYSEEGVGDRETNTNPRYSNDRG